MAQSDPLRFELEVPSDGRIEFRVPLPAGSHVTVYVTEHPVDDFADLHAAASSSTDFWNNPFDDEDWNEA
jgi:hypothetical protein